MPAKRFEKSTIKDLLRTHFNTKPKPRCACGKGLGFEQLLCKSCQKLTNKREPKL